MNRSRWRGKASDISSRLAREPKIDTVYWGVTTYSVQIAIPRQVADAIRGHAFNLSKPGYYLSHGKQGGFRRRRKKR